MKKCASCTKDLPEAALHCVFCGAKQAPAPAVQPSVAKTAFGYSANELIENVKQQQQRPAPAGSQPPQNYQQPPPQNYQQPPPQNYQPPPPQNYQQPPPQNYQQPPPQNYQQGHPPTAPQQAAASAATMFVPGGGVQPPSPAPMQSYQPPQLQPPPIQHAPPQRPGAPPMQQQRPGPSQPPPMQSPPYLASQTAARAGHPIEPWRDSLRAMMFIWGAITIAAFCTPVSIDPLAFNWDAIIHGEGKAKLPMLIVASVGLLSVVIAGIPMAAMPRGALAALFGLVGVLVPIAIAGGIGDHWQHLLELAGVLLLVPGLLARNEYREAVLPRVLVTLGVICMLLPMLLPTHGEIPLVSLFKGLIDLPGSAKVGPVLELVSIVLVVLALLAWMPAPATGGAKVIAWALILFPLLVQVTMLLLAGHVPEHVKATPYEALMAWAPGSAYVVLIGYGAATVLGKQLE